MTDNYRIEGKYGVKQEVIHLIKDTKFVFQCMAVSVLSYANNANIQTDTYDTPYRVGSNLIVISRLPAANSAAS